MKRSPVLRLLGLAIRRIVRGSAFRTVTTAFTILALASILSACSELFKRPPRHVIIISMDTTRADQFGFMGNRLVQTPRLDAIAAESIVLTDCMAVAPTTLASHTSLFTGKYPHHHGTPRNGYMVNRDNIMLAEILKEAGFTSAGFAGSFALDRRFDFAQGFDTYDQTFDVLVGDGGADENQRRAEKVTNAVVAYLDAQGVPDRLFLFAHYFDPHSPYAAPAPFHSMYHSKGEPGLSPAIEIDEHFEADQGHEQIGRRLITQYAAEISYMDFHIGRLFDELRRRGILDEAILLVTSDHGESLMEHPRSFSHGYLVYQATMHSVGVIRLPGGEGGGRRIEEPVSSIDLLPTLLDILGISPPPGIDGEAIPLGMTDDALPQRTRFGQATRPRKRHETDPRWMNILKARYIRSGRHKFIQTPYLGTEELYDLESDPSEQRNLLQAPSPETLEIAARLRTELTAWAESADPLPTRFEPSQRDETRERLKSLGYLVGP
jgi:arylsulfatase A-like enzyme